MKKKPLNQFHLPYKVILFPVILLPLFISCKSGNPEYTKCEEMCEYTKRDCIENCGGGNNVDFSFDFGGSGFSKPYACTEKCEKFYDTCIKRCGNKNTFQE